MVDGIRRNTIHSTWTASFYLDSFDQFYTLHTSATGIGDAGDAVNMADSSENGAQFYCSSYQGYCDTNYGPWWYVADYPRVWNAGGSCGYVRLFGNSSNIGFIWGWGVKPLPAGKLRAARMMVRLLNE